MKKEKFITVESFYKKWGVKFTFKHTGKMKNMISLSTCCKCNQHCAEHAKVKGSICEKCYAQRMLNNKFYDNLKKVLENNYKVLTTVIIPVEEWPIINTAAFRLEAFGDVDNEIQAINYFNFCTKNKQIPWAAAWTKNPLIFDNVIKAGHKKPKNLNIGISSILLNTVAKIDAFPWCDFVFTVYDPDYIKEHDIAINCGALLCIGCLKCYKKHKGVIYINELLK